MKKRFVLGILFVFGLVLDARCVVPCTWFCGEILIKESAELSGVYFLRRVSVMCDGDNSFLEIIDFDKDSLDILKETSKNRLEVDTIIGRKYYFRPLNNSFNYLVKKRKNKVILIVRSKNTINRTKNRVVLKICPP